MPTMPTYDAIPDSDPMVSEWVKAGTPRAVDGEGMIVLVTHRDGERVWFSVDLPGVVNGGFEVERDPEAKVVHINTGYVDLPSRPDAGSFNQFRDLGAPLKRRIKDGFDQVVVGWPLLGWSGHRCVFYE